MIDLITKSQYPSTKGWVRIIEKYSTVEKLDNKVAQLAEHLEACCFKCPTKYYDLGDSVHFVWKDKVSEVLMIIRTESISYVEKFREEVIASIYWKVPGVKIPISALWVDLHPVRFKRCQTHQK